MDSILFEQQDAIARITLNRPDVLNSFNRDMALLLQKHLEQIRDQADIRVVYLTGAGKAFCAGQDLQEVAGEKPPSFTAILAEHYNPIIKGIREIEKPFIAAVNGVAAGAGANLALACDIVVASNKAAFIQAFSKIGLIPDSGGTYLLPRLIGLQKAAALMMLGEKVNAEQAVEMGMIYQTLPDDQFADTAWKIAERLAALPPIGLGLTKRALNYALANDLDHQLEIETELQATAGMTEDYKEGMSAFLEKRTPNFKGK